MKEIEIEPGGHTTATWICAAIYRIGTRVSTYIDQQWAELGMTMAQFRVLRTVQSAGAGGIAPSALAGHLKIERATVSVLTNQMVERGLLVRLPGENRRTFNLALTETGTAVAEQILPTARTLSSAVLQELDAAQLAELRVMLMTIEETLDQAEKPSHFCKKRELHDTTDSD